MIGLPNVPGAGLVAGIKAEQKARSKELEEVVYNANIGTEVRSHNFTQYFDAHIEDVKIGDYSSLPPSRKLIFKIEGSMMMVKRGEGDWEYAVTLNNYYKFIGLNYWYAKKKLTKQMGR